MRGGTGTGWITSPKTHPTAIFDAEGVDLAWLPPGHPRRQQLENAGFEVIAKPGAPGDVRLV